MLFAGTGERIEITHRASRATYAQGSLRAVRFLAGRATACSTCSTCSASRRFADGPRPPLGPGR